MLQALNPLAWLNPGRWLLYIALALALWAGYAAWRSHQQELGYQRAVAEFKAQAQAADAAREVVTQIVEREVVKTVSDVQVVTETIIKEVPVYVQADLPPLPAGFRVLHDAAARGEVPQPAAIPDAAAVAPAAAARTIVTNYGACLENAERLRAFQQWATQQIQAR
jgi:hypothetical protein